MTGSDLRKICTFNDTRTSEKLVSEEVENDPMGPSAMKSYGLLPSYDVHICLPGRKIDNILNAFLNFSITFR